mmetsp:Transcript_43964/g.133938  ORF Transcript_43964/g.133938 Transcript_43964/m.133938 type:complete len:235 (+) Transcript_43964:141-845(+)
MRRPTPSPSHPPSTTVLLPAASTETSSTSTTVPRRLRSPTNGSWHPAAGRGGGASEFTATCDGIPPRPYTAGPGRGATGRCSTAARDLRPTAVATAGGGPPALAVSSERRRSPPPPSPPRPRILRRRYQGGRIPASPRAARSSRPKASIRTASGAFSEIGGTSRTGPSIRGSKVSTSRSPRTNYYTQNRNPTSTTKWGTSSRSGSIGRTTDRYAYPRGTSGCPRARSTRPRTPS